MNKTITLRTGEDGIYLLCDDREELRAIRDPLASRLIVAAAQLCAVSEPSASIVVELAPLDLSMLQEAVRLNFHGQTQGADYKIVVAMRKAKADQGSQAKSLQYLDTPKGADCITVCVVLPFDSRLKDTVPLPSATLAKLVKAVDACTCWNAHTVARQLICAHYASLSGHSMALRSLQGRHDTLGHLPEDGGRIRRAADEAIVSLFRNKNLEAQLEKLWGVL
jgi:hypothetical protein